MKQPFARIPKWLWAGVVAMAFLPAAVAADDWPMFRADAGRTGVVGTSGALNDALPWIFPTGGPIRSSPAIVGSTVYFGSDDGNVYAVNALSGELVWSVQTGGPVRTSPAVMDGFVFIGGVFGLFRISADVGNVEILFNEGSVDSSPAFVGDRVLFVTRSGELRAIDYRTLRNEWVYALPNPTVSSPAVVGGTVYVFSGSQLVAIDAEDGRSLPPIDLPASGAGNATPAIYNDRVYFVGVTDNVLYSISVVENLEESRQCLAYQDPVLVGLPGSSPAVSVIGIAYSTQGEPGVQIVGTPDESDRWKPCGDSSAAASTDLLAAQRPPSQMATANAEVAGSQREVYAGRKFSVSSALVPEPQSQSLLVSSPSMAGGVIVYVVQAVGTDIALYDVRIWDRNANSTAMLVSSDRAFEASPAISNGFVFIGCNDGNLYALRLDGEQLPAG